MRSQPLSGARVKTTTNYVARGLPTNDHQIRGALKEILLVANRQDPEALILEELGLRHGATRVDMVVVNGSLHGFEVKSDSDSLKRLPRQVKMYSEILDYATLVVGVRHADKAQQTIPSWWGVKLADRNPDGTVRLEDLRQPTPNPSPDGLAISKLLWREEALAFLEELGAADGVRSKPRREVYARLAQTAPLDGLRARVRRQFKSRTDWRSGVQQKSCGD
jgi:hypothetical protein